MLESARSFCQAQLQPRVRDMHRHEAFDPGVMRRFGELGVLGSTLHERCGGGLNYVSYGLIAREVGSGGLKDRIARNARGVLESALLGPRPVTHGAARSQ